MNTQRLDNGRPFEQHRPLDVRFRAGDYFYIWWDTGAMGPTTFYARVVRVNRKTYTIKEETGRQKRILIDGRIKLYPVADRDWHPEIAL